MKILIVDDEELIRNFIKELFLIEQLFEADEIYTAVDGLDGYQKFMEVQPQIMITDIRMPNCNGDEMIQKIRKQGIPVEIITITGFADIEMAMSIIRENVFELIRKPFKPQEILISVQKVKEKIRLIKENEEFRRKLLVSEKFSSLGLLSAGVAHEINNPNTFVKGNLELFQKYLEVVWPTLEEAHAKISKDSPDRNRWDIVMNSMKPAIADAIVGTQRIASIVSSLLVISRKSNSQKSMVSVRELIEQAISLTSHRNRMHEMQIEIPETVKKIKVNHQDVLQAFINIIVNAIDAIKKKNGLNQKGLLKISVTESNGQEVVAFSDNGTGMSKEVEHKCFDPFFSTKAQGKGTGLGMGLIKSNIESSGGAIFLETEFGKGTTIKLSFPLESSGN